MLYYRLANERGHANFGWLDSRHTFSFGNYYDANFMGFSDLRVINEDRVTPTMGFGTHPHKDMEILTYVLQGSIAHKDSMGNVKTFQAGEFQIMSAGTGITHSEFNPSDKDLLHFLQIWIMPNEFGIPPRYDQKFFENQQGGTLILSPNGENGAFKIYQDMQLWRYQLCQNSQDTLAFNPTRNYWLQVVKGDLTVNERTITQGDGIAISQENGLFINALNDCEFLLFDLR